MFVKSKFCLECNEKLEDYDDNFLIRSNYCEICKPSFRPKEILTRLGVAAFVIVPSLINFGLFLQKPSDKPLNVVKSEIASVAPAPKPLQKTNNVEPINHVEPKKVEVNQQGALLSKQRETPIANQTFDKKTTQFVPEVSQVSVPETAYMCGAKTKKGMPCSRKVKGSVRCWQHLGQDAMLPAKDLRIQ